MVAAWLIEQGGGAENEPLDPPPARALTRSGEIAPSTLIVKGRPPLVSTRRWILASTKSRYFWPAKPGLTVIPDVGRTQRLVTPPIRAALETRDRGCAFPGCDRPPVDCQAHHITPWWDGGHTALHNLVLLCPYHHNVIEPSHDPTAARWKIRIHRTGIPGVVPPAYVDSSGRARTHARYRSPAGSGGPARISPD